MSDFVVRKKSKNKQKEKTLQAEIMALARKMGHECIYVQYFCGARHYARCSGQKGKKHPERILVCPECGEQVVEQCNNSTNKHLAGQFDINGVQWGIFGIGWGIEVKNADSKSEVPKLSQQQELKFETAKKKGIPVLAVNQNNINEVFHFLNVLNKLNEKR
jgi:hypothetical protein